MKQVISNVKKIFLLQLWLFFILFTNCKNNSENIQQIDIPIDTIVWSNFSLRNTTIFPAKELTREKRYIKLKSGDSYLFGAADKVLYLENIYILDKRQKKIVVFNQEGEGVYTLHKVGQGPEEYLQITDFSVNEEGNIILIDGISDKLMMFGSKGEFIQTKKLPFEVDIIHCLKDKNYAFGLSTWNQHPETKGKRLVVTNEDLSIKHTQLNFDDNHDDSYWISYYTFVSNDNGVCYNKPIDDYVYHLSDDGLIDKVHFIDFETARIPNDWRKDIENNINNIQESSICLKNHTIITDKYIVGTLWHRTETQPFVADIKNKTVYVLKSKAESDIGDIVDFRDNSIISIIYPYKENIGDNEILPKDIEEHLATDNTVLCVTALM